MIVQCVSGHLNFMRCCSDELYRCLEFCPSQQQAWASNTCFLDQEQSLVRLAIKNIALRVSITQDREGDN